MIDTFRIGAYWADREESLDTVLNPTLETLIGLGELDDQFSNLYELGNTKKQIKGAVNLCAETIKGLYQSGLKKTDLDGRGYSKIGYRLSLWTGHDEDKSSKISFSVGSKLFDNLCLITVPLEGAARERLLQIDKAKMIIELLIQKWNPDVVIVSSRTLSNALEVKNEMGWLTYTKKNNSSLKLNNNIIREDNFGSGCLFYLHNNNGLVYDYKLMNQLLPLKLL